MTPPNVIDCTSEQPRVHPPPIEERTAFHPWSSSLNKRVCEAEPPVTYLYKIAEEKIRNHAKNGLDHPGEVMGLMVGGVFQWENKTYTLIRDVVTTDLESDMLGVRFQENGMERLLDSLDDLDFRYRIVGWYHSHPGIGCFLSHIDHGTQSGIFNQPYHSALVIDPIKKELEVYNGGDLVSFRLYWDLNQDPCP